jgi:hypothetical protein
MKLFDLVRGVYKTYNLGKYEGQYNMDILTYGFLQMSTLISEPEYTNLYYREYSKITFEYFYFNGKEWILDTEVIGGNDESWFNTYTDDYGHKFLQHKFELPSILLPYLTTFTIDSEGESAKNSLKNSAKYSLRNSAKNSAKNSKWEGETQELKYIPRPDKLSFWKRPDKLSVWNY